MNNCIKKLAFVLAFLISISFMEPQKITANVLSEDDITHTLSDEQIEGLIQITQNPEFSLAFSSYILNKLGDKPFAYFNFTNAAKRRYVLKWMGINGVLRDYRCSQNTMSKWLFGKSTSGLRKITGDVGLSYPSVGYGELANLEKVLGKKNLYSAFYNIYTVSEDGTCDSIGWVLYELKKKPGSKYGWIIKTATIGSH